MLVELLVENYAVVERVRVRFHAGLNLLTGETGAGKSILIDALALLLGDKASSDVIRSGAERSVVSAVFEISGATGCSARGFGEAGFAPTDSHGGAGLVVHLTATGLGPIQAGMLK